MARDVRVPLFWYLAITLALPAMHGAGSDPAFWAHAGTVAAVAAGLVGVRLVLRRMPWCRP